MLPIIKTIDCLNDWFGRLVAPLIAVMTLVVIYDIVLSYVVGRPSDWAFDVTTMLFGAHFMLLTAYGLRHHAHVEVDIIKRLLSRRGRALLDLLGYAIFFVPFIIMFITYSWTFFERSWSRGESTYGVVSIPVYPVKAVLVIAGVLILLQAIAIVLRAINELATSRSSMEDAA